MCNTDLSPFAAQECWLEIGEDSYKATCAMSIDPEVAVAKPASAPWGSCVADCPDTQVVIKSLHCVDKKKGTALGSSRGTKKLNAQSRFSWSLHSNRNKTDNSSPKKG